MSLGPYSPFSISFIIVGFVSTIYLLHIEEKTAAIRFMIAGMAGFTIGTAVMFASRIVLYGGALAPMIDAWAVFSMAAMVGFGYHYPRKVRSVEALVAIFLTSSIALFALSFSFYYAYQIIANQQYDLWIQNLFWFLNPFTFFVALIISIRRTLTLQREKFPGQKLRDRVQELIYPMDREVRLLRNFSLALSIGLIQGLAYGLELMGVIHPLLAPVVVDLSLLLMIVAIVYASFDLTQQQPGLITRLVGISLVTLLAILGSLGIFTVSNMVEQRNEMNIKLVEIVQQEIQNGELSTIPDEIVYLITSPRTDQQETELENDDLRLLYERQPAFDSQSLVEEVLQSNSEMLPSPIWQFYVEKHIRLVNKTVPVEFRYGAQPIGSYHQYAGYMFFDNESQYEVGFSLEEISQNIHRSSWGMVISVIVGSLVIVLIFPQLFRTNLIRPLDQLLMGVRRADDGDLDITVPVIHNDEIGFLAAAFNKMTASLREELLKRRHAEDELLELASTLEQRIVDRTRELSALYDVSAVASQAQDSESLLNESLNRTMDVLRCTTGMIFLQNENLPERNSYQLVTHQGLPANWLQDEDALSSKNRLFDSVISEGTPLLVTDVSSDTRLPEVMRISQSSTMIFAPLQSEGRVLGILGLARDRGNSFDLDEVALSVSIADQIGIAVQNDRLRQRAQQVKLLEERQNLARALHDSVTQSLYGLLNLTEAGMVRLEKGPTETVQHTLTRIGQTARQAIREMRLFIHQLRPPVLEQEGLVNALDLRLIAVEGRSDVLARLRADDDIQLPLKIETALFFIAQEALNNTLRHAQAGTVNINIYSQSNDIVMEIIDDGCGFEIESVKEGGMGLSNMRERTATINGNLEIYSCLGEGTQIKVSVDKEL